MIVGFDLDGVISLLPFGFKQIYVEGKGEKIFAFLQRFKSLQKLYNFVCRKPNSEVCEAMNILKREGHRILIISAAPEWNREEISKWLDKNRIYADELYLKPAGISSSEFKNKILYQKNCLFYLEDKIEIAKEINFLGPKRAYLYPEEYDSFLKLAFFPAKSPLLK